MDKRYYTVEQIKKSLSREQLEEILRYLRGREENRRAFSFEVIRLSLPDCCLRSCISFCEYLVWKENLYDVEIRAVSESSLDRSEKRIRSLNDVLDRHCSVMATYYKKLKTCDLDSQEALEMSKVVSSDVFKELLKDYEE